MTKHFATNSVLRRASQFESLNHNNHDQQTSNQADSGSLKSSSLHRNSAESNDVSTSTSSLIRVALNRFQSEFGNLFPESSLPFEELHSVDDARKYFRLQQQRIAELSKELNQAKYTAKFLEEIISRSDANDFDKASCNSNFTKATKDDSTKEEASSSSSSSKEQYVTVIRLNDSTYGEIHKVSSIPLKSEVDDSSNGEEETAANSSELLGSLVSQKSPNQTKESNDCEPKEKQIDRTKEISEPIYSNTLEAPKPSERVSKKRPPTPPRKPKFNKLQGSSGDIFASVSNEINSVSKSDSLQSLPRLPRKFVGPVQQVIKLGSNHELEQSQNATESIQTSTGSKRTYRRTFSHEPTTQSTNADDDDNNKQFAEDGENSELYQDYDNIYDTVAPDSDCDTEMDKVNTSHDDDLETSSHEMLSRSSSTDEGLNSNYVNIDYFLRKNSLGRSNSNLPERLKTKSYYHCEEADDDNETNLSSMKSSDYEPFSSNENLLNSMPSQQSTSLKSFHSSASTTSSVSGSSLRKRNLPFINANTDLSSSYPPNLSTFTPPVRDRNQPAFFKDSAISELEESSVYSNGSELNITPSSKYSSPDSKSNSISAEYYASYNILKSCESNQGSKTDLVAETALSEQGEQSSYGQSSFDSPLNDSSEQQGKSLTPTSSVATNHRQNMQWNIIRSIIESETLYLDCLNTLIKYMNALKSASSSKENALLSTEDLNVIFYKIPELYKLHQTFLNGLKVVEKGFKMRHSTQTADSAVATKFMSKHSIGELFHTLATNLHIYSDFLRNYSLALETANRCSANNTRFSEIIKSIKVVSMSKQFTNLVDSLHLPVARLQKNALVLDDLLKHTDPDNEEEKRLLNDALKMTRAFLVELNEDATRKLFPVQDKFQRRLVKESFIVESGSDRRKLRHLFLFNDVIVCAKYKASTKQKFTFELKWFQMLNDVVLDPVLETHCSSNPLTLSRKISAPLPQSSNSGGGGGGGGGGNGTKDDKESLKWLHVPSLKLRAFILRYEMFTREKRNGGAKMVDKYRKKISELESELVLWLPQLKFSFNLRNHPNKCYIFYLSSEYERACWFEAIKRMQQSASLRAASNEHASQFELQKWIETCRKSINPNLGSFLLRTNKDESLRFGDLVLRVVHLNGIQQQQQQSLFMVIETDSYGHYFKQSITRHVTRHPSANINQEFLFELEGTQSLRILLYEDSQQHTDGQQQIDSLDRCPIFRGKASIDLTSCCLSSEFKVKELSILEYSLMIEMSFISWPSMWTKIPPSKIYGIFGITVSQVCKKEKSKVPYLITCCINEVQRRGLKEVGIYRVSGLSSDVQRLKKLFETNPRDAIWLIRGIDIHAVTGLLKLYLRELPESLFTNDMYRQYLEARDLKNQEEKDKQMTSLLSQLPEPNQATVVALIDHLTLVNQYEDDNKMSLNNLATIFGPTMLRTNSSAEQKATSKSTNLMSGSGSSHNAVGGSSSGGSGSSNFTINTDLFTASTIDVMAQADILYYFLRRKSEGLSLISIDREETSL